jgi:hypothetical protein
MPEDAWIGVPRLALLALFLGIALAFEAGRLALGVDVFGLRDYEHNRVAAYAWGGVGLALALLFFPAEIGVPVVVGMAWVDPLCAWSRARGLHPYVPLAGWFAIGAALMIVLAVPAARAILLAAVGAAVAVAAEAPHLRWVDDDFSMIVAPLLALGGLATIL